MTDRWFAQVERLLFGLMLAVPALLGVALISIAHTFAHDSLAHDLVRDLGVASFVSVLITVVIEIYARNRLQAEIRSVLIVDAVKRLIRVTVLDTINNTILS